MKTKSELLKNLEWSSRRQGQGSGPMSSGGPLVRCCPSCGGICPTDPNRNHFVESSHGHRATCELASELSHLDAGQEGK